MCPPDLGIAGMAVSLESARNNTLCMPAELSGFAAYCRVHCTSRTVSCQCNAMDEIHFACEMKSAVSSKARELSRHTKGVVSGTFQ